MWTHTVYDENRYKFDSQPVWKSGGRWVQRSRYHWRAQKWSTCGSTCKDNTYDCVHRHVVKTPTQWWWRQGQEIRTIRTIRTVSKVLFFFEYRNKICRYMYRKLFTHGLHLSKKTVTQELGTCYARTCQCVTHGPHLQLRTNPTAPCQQFTL